MINLWRDMIWEFYKKQYVVTVFKKNSQSARPKTFAPEAKKKKKKELSSPKKKKKKTRQGSFRVIRR